MIHAALWLASLLFLLWIAWNVFALLYLAWLSLLDFVRSLWRE